jgi:predicted GH43/DUF377 family glycosyl hydrolase
MMKKSFIYSGAILFLLSISSLPVSSQINWIKYPGNPVMTPGPPGSFNNGGYPFITVMANNDTLDMWYTASDQQQQIIGLARSTDGCNFDFCPSVPCFEPSPDPQAFDCKGVFNAQILHISDTSWYMWFSGLDISNFNSQVGLAVSSDGLNWQRYSEDPVLSRGAYGSWDYTVVYAGTVLFDEGIYKMWYTGMNGSDYNIGYAASSDGITWAKYEDNPILHSSANPKVIKTAGSYQMWFNANYGNELAIWYATSNDGISWQTSGMPVLRPDAGTFDDEGTSAPSVVFDSVSGLYQLWYTAWSGSTNSYSVGYATDSTLVNIMDQDITGVAGLKCFPNPVRSQAFITFTIPEISPISIAMYDIYGKKVLDLVNGSKYPGMYRTAVNTEDLPAGIYLCRLVSGTRNAVTKLIVIK